LLIVWHICAAAGILLAVRLAQLQIIEGGRYRLAAEKNSTQMIYQTAPRGRIYDRNGVALATNEPAFSLIYLPSKLGQKAELGPLARELATQLHEDPQSLLERLEEAVSEQAAVRLAENLPPKTMFRLSELQTLYPGIELIVEARRSYPFGSFASHLIGYMGKMDKRSWLSFKSHGYRIDSRIGRIGLEGRFESELRGQDGGIRMEVDAQGRIKRALEKMPWQPGSNVRLSIDYDIQKASDDALRRSVTGRGAIVVIDPKDGSILALSSAPDFDPNVLLAYDPSLPKRRALELPEFNRAISGTYAPGSTFKPIVSLAGLNEGKLNPRDTIFCPGYFELGKNRFACWLKNGHKKTDFLQGFSQSCDVYFYKAGLKIGASTIERYARMFGLGQKTHVALLGEKAGNLFGPQSRAENGRSWYDGDTVNLSIGQGELLVTPMQMAVVAATLANRGTIWRPHYIDRIEFADGRPEYKQKSEKVGSVAIQDSVWDLLDQAMVLVVTSGTAHQAAVPGISVRGKTGTAENPSGEDHAWFIAYAGRPGEAPTIALAVLVENGGHGSSAAVPLAHDVIAAAFHVAQAKRPASDIPARLRTPVGHSLKTL
jgi:penicillin-binding protein 2